jgi:hypothetical protein
MERNNEILQSDQIRIIVGINQGESNHSISVISISNTPHQAEA